MRYTLLVLILVFISFLRCYSQTESDTTSCESHCLCSVDPTPSGIMISHVHEKQTWMISYRLMSMQMKKILSGTGQVSDETVFNNYLMSEGNMRMDMHMLMAMYGLSDRITIMAMTQYSNSSMTMIGLPGTVHHMDGSLMNNDDDLRMHSSGFGDIKLNILYNLVSVSNHQLLVSVGGSIPTGSIQIKGEHATMYANQRMPYGMQLGSGTFDILPVLNYTYNIGSATFSSQLSSVYRTGRNKAGYSLGNEYTLNNWMTYQWNGFLSSSLRLEGNFSETIQGEDNSLHRIYEPSANPVNYGGKALNSFLGSNVYFRKGILKNNKLGAEFGLPIYQYLNGPQLAKSSSLFVSWSLLF